MTIPEKRKRLGQYLTDRRLARLLALLARAELAGTVVDPMAGAGDMIAACAECSPHAATLAAVEIDPAIQNQAAEEMNVLGVQSLRANAFDPETWSLLGFSWDLVITNPPYVRYQLGGSVNVNGIYLPSSREVRRGLLDCLAQNPNLGVDRDHFTEAAKSFSGLSDLAVPSWLLCCSLVRPGGRLAMIVPDTWLTRDYAAPVLHVLQRLFDLHYVVEDNDISWFKDAMIRTNLVVATRHTKPVTPFEHRRISVSASITGANSVVEHAFPDSDDPDMDFVTWADSCHLPNPPGLTSSWSDGSDLSRRVNTDRGISLGLERGIGALPEAMAKIISHAPDLIHLADLGWKIGQGLRTGGNDFFYVSADPSGNGFRSRLLPGERLDLPTDVLRSAIRRQSELPVDCRCIIEPTQSFVLALEGWALPEDIKAADGPRPWQPIGGDLARLVQAGAAKTYHRRDKMVPLPELSAVRTNVRPGATNPPQHARFWYQLPPLALRHTPDIYLARVNGGVPTPYLNPMRRIVVDANFSTLWATSPGAMPAPVLLGLLSSAWTAAFLEATSTVLGGGALKVEAAHLRQLLLPIPVNDAAGLLAAVAGSWCDQPSKGKPDACIDDIVSTLLGCSADGGHLLEFARERLLRRTG